MRKSIVVIAVLGLVVASAPMARADATVAGGATAPGVAPAVGDHAHPLMNGEHMGRIREEIHLHEQRAHELDPIIARDRQARHDVEVDWVVLERHARDLHARANDFRGYASEFAGRGQMDMNNFATELDTSASHDEDNARLQHEIADRLDRAIESAAAMRDWHLKMAQRLRDWLAANGG